MNQQDIPEVRAYTHRECSGETIVGTWAFHVLSDPLSGIDHAWCETCDDHYPLSEFSWSDTGEKISDYYARHSAAASSLQRFLCSRAFLIIMALTGTVIGVLIAIVMFRDDGLPTLLLASFTLGVIGLILFGCVKEFVLGPMIIKRVYGVSDTRLLK